MHLDTAIMGDPTQSSSSAIHPFDISSPSPDILSVAGTAPTSGSLSPLDRSRAASYPQTPPNSFGEPASLTRRNLIDTQELFSKLDSELTREESDEEGCCTVFTDSSIPVPVLKTNGFTAVDVDSHNFVSRSMACQMVADGTDLNPYVNYVNEVWDSDDLKKSVAEFVSAQNFNNENCPADESQPSLDSQQNDVPEFSIKDVLYREPELVIERDLQERREYLAMQGIERVRLVPSDSLRNMVNDGWLDDEIGDHCQLPSMNEPLSLEEEDRLAAEMDSWADASGEDLEWDDDFTEAFKPAVSDFSQNQQQQLRKVRIGNGFKMLDLDIIASNRCVLSHGGYTSNGHDILVFAACYLPPRNRVDVLDQLFLYVLASLRLLIEDRSFVIVYLHAGRGEMASLSWFRKCYRHIPRQTRKALQTLYLVHPDFWLRTSLKLSKLFTSSKFDRKTRFVANLDELERLLPLDYVHIPDAVHLHNARLCAEQRESSATCG